MRSIKPTGRYVRDYKGVSAGIYGKQIDKLDLTIAMLATDQQLPVRFHDHALKGQYRDCRDCHIWPDLVLIYRKGDDNTLELVRLGSHSELGL